MGAMVIILYSIWDGASIFLSLAGLTAAALGLRYLFHLVKHFRAFLSHMATVRRARIIYEETGEKTDRSIPGYTSINTLMLSALVGIIGVFSMGVVAYHCFTYVPETISHSGY